MKLTIDIPEPFAERVLAAFADHAMADYRPATVAELENQLKEYIWKRLSEYETWQEGDAKQKRLKREKEKW